MAETKRCPYCGEEILAVAKKCKYCGEWLDKEEPKKESKKMVQCPVCGEDIEEGTEVCPYCHERVNVGGGKAAPVEKPKKMVPCPVCGEDIEEGTEVCPYCHEHIGQGKAAPQGGAVNRPVQTTAQPYAQQARQPHSQPTQPTYSQPQQQAYGGKGGYDDGDAGYEYDDEENIGLFDYYYVDVFFRHYADFSGVLGRKRFWIAYLFNTLFAVALMAVDMALFGFPGILSSIYSLAVLIPSIAFMVRRLRDTGKSGWWILTSLVPFVGPLILLVLLCMPGETEADEVAAETKDYVIIGVSVLLIIVCGILGVKKMMDNINAANSFLNGETTALSGDDSSSVDEDAEWGTDSDGSSDVVDDEEGKDFVTEFYQYYFDEKKYDGGNRDSDEALIDDFCSEKMKQKARDAFPYDYDGSVPPYWYAIFRTELQDGDGDSRLVNVESMGDGEFKVKYLDAGHEGTSKIKLVKENGDLKIDDVELMSVKEH